MTHSTTHSFGEADDPGDSALGEIREIARWGNSATPAAAPASVVVVGLHQPLLSLRDDGGFVGAKTTK